MPSQSSHVVALRAGSHQRQVYLSDLSGDIVLTATVSSTPSAVSAINVAISVVSGSAANVKRGMRVVVKSSGGDPKGVLHIRAAGTISSATLPLREFSSGQVKMVSGDVLTVYDDFPVVDKLVAANELFPPDYETYVDQFSDPKPLVGSGSHYAGWLADSSAVPTDGSACLNLDPDTANTFVHLWATTGGSLSSSSTASPMIDFSGAGAGKYRVDHTVTAVNGKARTQSTRYRIHDADDPPYSGVEDSPLAADPLYGWTYSIRVFDPAAFNLSPLAPVAVWIDELIGGTRQSFGAKVAGRSHIKCIGYLRRARSGWDTDAGRYYVSYDIVSALQLATELPGFSKVMEYDQTPDTWSTIKTLTIKRGFIYLALYYTNINEAGHDIVFDDDGMMDKVYPAFYLQKTNPVDQWRELAGGADCRITSDRIGRIECQLELPYTDYIDRGSVITTFTLTKNDLVGYDMDHDFKEPVETYHMRGIEAGSSGNDPLFFKWPASPAYGNSSPSDEKLICDDFTEGAARAARRGAWNNRSFTDSSGIRRHAPHMTVRLPGGMDIFDLYREWVGVEIADEPRLGDTSVFRWMIESISYSGDGGTGTQEVTLQAETNGYDAVDDTPPDESDNGLGNYTPGDDLFDPLPLEPVPYPPYGLSKGTKSMFAVNTDGFWYRVRVADGSGFDIPAISGGPVWTRASMGVSGTVLSGCLDAGSLKTASIDGYVVTSTGIYKVTDSGGGTPAVALKHSLAHAATTAIIDTSINAPGWVLCIYHRANASSPGTYAAYSTDDGLTWNEATITAFYDVGADYGPSVPLWINILPAGWARTMAYHEDDDTSIDMYETRDYGATWSLIGTGTINVNGGRVPGGTLHSPWHMSNPLKVYYFRREETGSASRTELANGAGVTDITPVVGGLAYGPRGQRALVTSTGDNQTAVMIGTTATTGHNGESALLKSRTGGTIWTLVEAFAAGHYTWLHIPDERDVVFLAGLAGLIEYSGDFLVTRDSRSGNIPTDFPSAGAFIVLWGI